MKIKYGVIGALCSILLLNCNAMEQKAVEAPKKYTLQIGDFIKEYNVVPPKGNNKVKIVYAYDFNDNIHLGKNAVANLVQQLKDKGMLGSIDAVVLPGDKGNMLGTLLYTEIEKQVAQFKDLQFCIVRSAEKAEPLYSVEYFSITGGLKKLYMREDQANRLKGKRALIFDDVISTGGTLMATKSLVEKCGCEIVAYACVATEGEKREDFGGKPLVNVTHLPVFSNK